VYAPPEKLVTNAPDTHMYGRSALDVSTVLPNIQNLEIVDPARFFRPDSFAGLTRLTHLWMLNSVQTEDPVLCHHTLSSLELDCPNIYSKQMVQTLQV
jgi:hypothetical protein